MTVRNLIDQRAEETPNVSFLVSPGTGRLTTFQDLLGQSILLSAQLRREGLMQGDKVAFLLDNTGPSTAQVLLGILYGDFVAVPLNVSGGVSQLPYMLRACDAKVIFVESQYVGLLEEALGSVQQEIKVIPVGADGVTCEPVEDPTSVLPRAACDGVASLVRSSGSIGRSKAAAQSRPSVVSDARSLVVGSITAGWRHPVFGAPQLSSEDQELSD